MKQKHEWPALYKKSSAGAIIEWRVAVDGNTIIEHWGQRGGKVQSTQDIIEEGKNIGKVNATTPEQQAYAEAEAKWTKKLRGHNYVKTLVAATAGESSDLVAGGILPMLAQKFSEHGDKLAYPCFAQPKYDGHRCIAMSSGLWSRTRKPITGVPHIMESLRRVGLPLPLDGELYNHVYRENFEQLSHFIRQQTPDEGYKVVQYHVYDAPIDGTFRERWNKLSLAYTSYKDIYLVPTIEVQDEDELMLVFEDFLAQGYEGAIARNAEGLYVNKRSFDLLKIKKFDDGEFKCVGVEEGRGKFAGHGIFVCCTKDGTEFRAKLKGAQGTLKEVFNNPKAYIGSMITVKHQGITNKSGVPRFPVAWRIRND